MRNIQIKQEKEEKDRNNKQKFLFNQILKNLFKINIFEKYLNFEKGGIDGENIDNWGLAELKEKVKEFKHLFKHSIDFDQVSDNTREFYQHKTGKESGELV